MRRLTLCLFSLLAMASVAQAEKWCFVVAGDGRADGKGRAEDKDGVNTLITGEIARAVVAEHAKALLWTGDLVLGSKNRDVHEKQLLRWRETMEPVYANRIPVLACRGNHEAFSADDELLWNKVFSGPYRMPQNGPAGEKNLTFYWTHGPVLAVGLDQYKKETHEVDQKWLDGVFRSHRRPFVFAMGHEPAFMDGAHEDTMDNDASKRDRFWTSFMNAGGRVFFAGHDHLYDHMVVTRHGEDRPVEVHQIVAGTAGAPFYKEGEYRGKNAGWDLQRVWHIDNTYGYVLVTIDGSKATVQFKGRTAPGKYEVMDTFSYNASARGR